MSAFVIETTPFPYDDRYLLVAYDGTILLGEKLNIARLNEGPPGLFAAHDLTTNTWGIVNRQGEEVVPFEFDKLGNVRSWFELTRGEETIYVDGDSNILSEPPQRTASQIRSEILATLDGFTSTTTPEFLIFENTKENLWKAYTTSGDPIDEWHYRHMAKDDIAILGDFLVAFHHDGRKLVGVKVHDQSGKLVADLQQMPNDKFRLASASCFPAKKNDKWGYLDRAFQPVTDFIYHMVTPMILNRGFVQTEEDGPWTLVDETGAAIKTLEPGWFPQYYGREQDVEFYIDGLIPITAGDQKLVMNRDGEVIVPLGSSRIAAKTGYIAYQNADGLTGVITSDGTPVLPHEFDWIAIAPFGDEVYFRASKGGLVGYLGEDGEDVLPKKYKSLGYINELGQFYAQDNESKKFGMLDIHGNEVLPFKHDKLSSDRYGANHGFWISEYGKVYYNLETGLTFRIPEDFRDLGTNEKLLIAQFSNVDFAIDKQGHIMERVKFKNVPLTDEKNHTYALEQLVEDLNAKAAKSLFKKVLYWHKSYWDFLGPHLKSEHLPVVEALLMMAAKKPYGKDVLAGGEEFFIEGLRIVGELDPDRVEPLAEELLEAGGRKKDRREKLAAALESATSLSLQEPKKVVPLPHLTALWAPVYDLLQQAHGDAADWSRLDEILSGDLRAAVEAGALADNLQPFEKALDKVAKKEKTDDVKELRDSVVVLRAWSERRPGFEDGYLNGPASEEELAELQALYETPLPLSFLVSYRLYNGVTTSKVLYMNGGDLLFSPVRDILREYKHQQKYVTQFISDPKREETLREHVQTWLPLFNSNGNAWVLNMGTKLSGLGGRPILTGSIFNYNMDDRDLRELKVVYSSFKRLVEDLSGATDL